jgi:betaine lipid synthase
MWSRPGLTCEKEHTVLIWLLLQIGGGTGFNIEAMSKFVNVPDFFSSVYLVDFSPSLCEVARKRFEKLGWTNVTVVCEDARKFRLEDYESGVPAAKNPLRSPALSYFTQQRPDHGGADLVTMSYSLSMIVSPMTHLAINVPSNSLANYGPSLTTIPWLTR